MLGLWREDVRRLVRRPALPILLLLVVIVGIAAALILQRTYRRDLNLGAQRAESLALLLEEQTTRNFQAVDLVLQGIADSLVHVREDNDPALRSTLKRRLAALPHVRAIFVIGPDGFISHDTDYPLTPRISLADRGYFQAHHKNGTPGLFIGPPLKSRSVERWFVSVSRRVDTSDGTFDGVVVAAVEPLVYEKFFTDLKLGSDDAVSLLHADGTLIARVPESLDQIGKPQNHLTLFQEHYPARRAATYRAAAELPDNQERIVSFRAVSGYPLIITVALSLEALLSNWRGTAYAAATGYLMLIGLSILAATFYVQRSRERRRARQRAMIGQKLETLGQMTSGVSHDFNNILAVAASGLTLAEKHAGDPIKLQAHLSAIREAIDRGVALASQLLSFAKRQQLEVTPTDANVLLVGLEPMLRQAAGSQVTVTLKLMEDLPRCWIDRSQFEAAVLNLVLNARDAMLEGGTVEIATKAATPQEVTVTVCDNGQGIDAENLNRVFEPFFTTKGERGTGLGLAQVYASMQQMGGDALITSAVGQGTCVELRFRAC